MSQSKQEFKEDYNDEVFALEEADDMSGSTLNDECGNEDR